MAKKKAPLPFNISDVADAEMVNYNNDTNINDVFSKKSAQIAAKKIVKKYKNLARKKPYQRPPRNTVDDLADLETIKYNNDTNISDLSDIPSGPKNNKNTQIAAKKIGQKYKKLAQKKSLLSFNISDVADAETVDYNNDTNINYVSSNKSAQIAAKKIFKKYRNLARKKPYQRPSKKTDNDIVFLQQVPVHPMDRLSKKTKDHIKFVKQVPAHPLERLKRKRKKYFG